MNELKNLKHTLHHIDRRFFGAVLIECAYFLLAYALSNPIPVLDIVAAKEMDTFVFDQAQMLMNESILTMNTTLLYTFIAKLILVMFGFLLFHALLYSTFTYLSWSVLLHKPVFKEHHPSSDRTFITTSFCWIFFWMILGTLAVFIFQPESWIYLFLFFFAIFVFKTTLFHSVLIHKPQGIRKTIKAYVDVVLEGTYLSALISLGILFIAGSYLVLLLGDFMLDAGAMYSGIILLWAGFFGTLFRLHLYRATIS